MEQIVFVNGFFLSFRDIGYGSPVVLLHGYGQNNRAFLEVERDLVLWHRLILIDSRGHGRSETGDEPLSIRLMSEDVAALLDILHIDSATIIGYSDGGNIALQLAVDHPEKTTAVVAISGNARPEGLRKAFLRAVRGWQNARDFFGRNTDRMNLLTRNPQLTDQELAGITTPVLLIYGQHDLVSREHMQEISRLIPRARMLIIPRAHHETMIRHWKHYRTATEAFMSNAEKERF